MTTERARASAASLHARRFWLDGAAVLAMIFGADLLVVSVLEHWVVATGRWQAALLEAALLSAVLAAPLYWLMRAAGRASEGDARWSHGLHAAAPFRQRRLRAALYGTLLVMCVAGGWQVWQSQRAEAAR